MPECMQRLSEPHRYYVLYGGRLGLKTWSVARHLLTRGIFEKIRVLCARETMEKISESVHTTLVDQIALLGYQRYYDVQEKKIQGTNGTRFVYTGLQSVIRDKTALKAYESFDALWVEEAQSCSHASWMTMIPTLRKKGSQFFVTFNPELETDDTYKRFILQTPPDCCLIKTSYRDNPWLSKEAIDDMEYLRATDPDEFEHVYEGACVQNVRGAVFAKEMRIVDAEQRIRAVPYNNSRPVDAFWDIGDRWTAIWLAQAFPFETRMIEYAEYEASSLADIVRDLQTKGYLYGCHWLPHDARAPQLSTGRTIEEQLRSAGYKVQVVPRVSVSARLNMLRLAFPQLWFDGDKCADGLQRLRHYRWSPEGTLGIEHREPLHDVNSHACLVGETIVRMTRGYKRIDQITPGEQVWTPRGPATVLHAGFVKKTNDLITIKTTCGKTLTGTPEHKIFTNRGLIKMDALRYTDRILGGCEWSSKAISFFSKVTNIGYREIITGGTNGQLPVHPIYIEQSGKTLMDQCRKAMRFITKILIPSTINWKTLSFYPNQNINVCIPSSEESKAFSKIPPSSRINGPQNGMDRQKASNGIENTEQNVGKAASALSQLALYAVRSILLLSRVGRNTALRHVRKWRSENAEDYRSVYDLTVKNHACYQANGILVSNSDALSYMAVVVKTPTNREPLPQRKRPIPVSPWV